ncbi:class II aldolase/adducin family protein [Aggregatilineales bacterium SYSU G02658]
MLRHYKSLTHSVVSLANAGRTHSKLRDSLASKKVQEALVKTAHHASSYGLSVGMLSSASVRLKGDKFLITNRQALFSDLTAGDLVIGSLQSSPIVREEELPQAADWHRVVYSNTSAQWVLLVQPTSIMALMYRQRALDPRALPAAAEQLGTVVMHNGAPDALRLSSEHAQVGQTLLAGMGILIWAESSREALARAQLITRWADVMLAGEIG